MGLKDATKSQTAAATTPAFETEDETMNTTENNTQAGDQAQASAKASTTIAKASAGAVAASTQKKFEMAFADKQWAFDEDAVVGLSMSVPRIKGEQGGAYIEQTSLGGKFRIEVESWNPRLLISSGLQSSDAGYQEAMEYLRTSYDGATIHGEDTTVAEYIEHLKEMGYNKARASKYIDLFGFVTWKEKGGDVAPEARALHLVQLSQTSAGNFAAFCTTQGLLRSKGLVTGDGSVIEVHADARSKGNNKYTNFSFHTV